MSKAAELAALIGSQTALSNRNLIINGAMQVAQRGTSATVGPNGTGEGYTVVDRWDNQLNGAVVSTFSQSTDAPSGFGKSAKIEITTADASLSSTEFWFLRQKIEGQNLQAFAKGTSDAKAFSLSFWVKSNKTGTYTVELHDVDTSGNRSASLAYTISSSNTWEHKTLTFNADTTGPFNNDNGESLRVQFWLVGDSSYYSSGTFSNGTWEAQVDGNRVHSSQVNLGDTVGNEWYITGVQLELGEQATPFEHRSFGDELARCQRYFAYAQAGITGAAVSSTHLCLTYYPRVEFRALPTLSLTGNLKVDLPSVHNKEQSSTAIEHSFSDAAGGAINMFCGNFSGLTRSDFYVMRTNGDIHFDAEL